MDRLKISTANPPMEVLYYLTPGLGHPVVVCHGAECAEATTLMLYQQESTGGLDSVSVEDAVAELRSTRDGKRAWRRAVRARASSFDEALKAGIIGKIKYYRFLREITQKQLAQMVGTKQSNIARYERPSYRASRATLEKLARALGVEVPELL